MSKITGIFKESLKSIRDSIEPSKVLEKLSKITGIFKESLKSIRDSIEPSKVLEKLKKNGDLLKARSDIETAVEDVIKPSTNDKNQDEKEER